MAKKKMTLDELLDEALVTEDEQPYKVPENWLWSKLGEIVTIRTGKRDANHGSEDGKYLFFTCASEPIKSHTYSFEGESIILPGNGANVGLALYCNDKFEAYQRTYVVQGNKIILKYLYYNLKYHWKEYNDNKQYGTATNYIKLGNLTEYKLPIPPIKEQQRIVNRIEAFFDKLHRANELIEEAREGFKNRKAAILAKAFRGELSGKWREDNSCVDSGEELLKRIEEERVLQYDKELKYAKINGKKKPTKQKRYTVDINQKFDLPLKWQWCSLGDVVYDFKYGTSEKSDYNYEGCPVIRIPNIDNLMININDMKFLKSKEVEESNKVKKGDLLIIRSNGSRHLVAKSALVNQEEGYAYASYLIRIRPLLVDSKFILYLLNDREVKEQFYSKSKSTAGINNINTQELATTIIPLPPLEEQKEIVCIIDKLLEEESRIEELTDVEEQIEGMKKAILAKAFRGEMETNDHEEESALELLKEVLGEKVK